MDINDSLDILLNDPTWNILLRSHKLKMKIDNMLQNINKLHNKATHKLQFI